MENGVREGGKNNGKWTIQEVIAVNQKGGLAQERCLRLVKMEMDRFNKYFSAST